jgi:hypothetical protein
LRASTSGRFVAQQQQSLVERVKPGMEATEQARLFEDAKAFGLRLDAALDQVAQECQCALINSAALLKVSSAAAIPDLVRTGGGTRWHGASKPVGAVIDAVPGHCRVLLLLRKRVSEQRAGVPVDVDL